jgi:hypothetical protein
MGYIAGRSPMRFMAPSNYNGLAGLLGLMRGLGDCGDCIQYDDSGNCIETDSSGCSTTTPSSGSCPSGQLWDSSVNACYMPLTSSGTGAGPSEVPVTSTAPTAAAPNTFVVGSSVGCAPGYVVLSSDGQCGLPAAGSVSTDTTAGAVAAGVVSTESLLGKLLAPQTQVYNAAGQLVYSGPSSGAPSGAGLTATISSSNLLLYGGLAAAAVLVIMMMKK